MKRERRACPRAHKSVCERKIGNLDVWTYFGSIEFNNVVNNLHSIYCYDVAALVK